MPRPIRFVIELLWSSVVFHVERRQVYLCAFAASIVILPAGAIAYLGFPSEVAEGLQSAWFPVLLALLVGALARTPNPSWRALRTTRSAPSLREPIVTWVIYSALTFLTATLAAQIVGILLDAPADTVSPAASLYVLSVLALLSALRDRGHSEGLRVLLGTSYLVLGLIVGQGDSILHRVLLSNLLTENSPAPVDWHAALVPPLILLSAARWRAAPSRG